MKNEQSTNRQFLLATIVTVGAFCFWPNWLTGLFAFGSVIGWIVNDSHDFLRAVWRTVLVLVILIGIGYAALWITLPPGHLLLDQIPWHVAGASVVVALAVFGLVRSILNARKDWTIE
jgi:hypothetical protein